MLSEWSGCRQTGSRGLQPSGAVHTLPDGKDRRRAQHRLPASMVRATTSGAISVDHISARIAATGINLIWVFSIIPIAFMLLSLRILVNIRRRWLDMTDDRKEM